jgi:hypothetical protein
MYLWLTRAWCREQKRVVQYMNPLDVWATAAPGTVVWLRYGSTHYDSKKGEGNFPGLRVMQNNVLQ